MIRAVTQPGDANVYGMLPYKKPFRETALLQVLERNLRRVEENDASTMSGKSKAALHKVSLHNGVCCRTKSDPGEHKNVFEVSFNSAAHQELHE